MNRLEEAFTLQKQNEYDRAAELYDVLLVEMASNPNVWHLAGANECYRGNTEKGLKLIAKANAISENSMYHNTAGTILLNLNHVNDAARSFARAIELKPDYPEATYYLGLCYFMQRDYAKAGNYFQKALSLAPNFSDAAFRLGNCYQESGDFGKALALYTNALTLAPSNLGIKFSIGTLKEQAGDLVGALEVYASLVDSGVSFANAYVRKIAVLERLGYLDECQSSINSAKLLFPDNRDIALTQAKVLKRNGMLAEAATLLNEIVSADNNEAVSYSAFFENGVVHDKLGNAEKAYDSFVRGNQLVLHAHGEQLAALQRKMRDNLSDMEALQFRPYPLGNEYAEVLHQDKLVFLIGFPRTGTTLIDSILSVDSRVKTYEECPALDSTFKMAAKMFGGKVADISMASQNQLNELRNHYFSVLVGEDDVSQYKIIMDRHPFNTYKIPLIRVLFPKARIVMTNRQRQDTLLSCFMQDFQIHTGTSFLFSLEDASFLYDAFHSIVAHDRTMSLSESVPNIHDYHYEDLVNQTEVTVKGILQYMGLNWLPEMADHSKHSKRQVVSTVSYDQVVQPIYGSAKNRWKRYENLVRF